MESPADDALAEFVAVMRRLRAECPWKQEQTHRSLARYLLEETHETLEAIDSGDMAHLREELGDLLLQVVFHAVIAEQAGEFDLDDVARDITDKMRRRNPHVFAPSEVEELAQGASPAHTAASVTEVWEQIKATEKGRDHVTDGLPPGLPALLYADKVLDRLAREGRSEPPLVEVRRVQRGASKPPAADDLGDRLLALVAESRERGVDPEQALRDAVRRLL